MAAGTRNSYCGLNYISRSRNFYPPQTIHGHVVQILIIYSFLSNNRSHSPHHQRYNLSNCFTPERKKNSKRRKKAKHLETFSSRRGLSLFLCGVQEGRTVKRRQRLQTKRVKGGEERTTNGEAASRYLITRTLCKIGRVSKINIRLELMFVSRSKHENNSRRNSSSIILLRDISV